MLAIIGHVLGLDDGTGGWYLFWSGFGADLGEFGIIGSLYVAYRRHACHVHRCLRIARHPVDGTDYVVCAKHHPEARPMRPRPSDVAKSAT